MGLLAYVGSWAATIAGVWFLFSKAEDLLVSEKKEKISTWLASLSIRNWFNLWPDTFISVFDSIFGTQHFSWFCFKRSVIASFISITIVTLIWIAFREQQFLDSFERQSMPNWYPILVMAAIILNTIPDYLSLLETRYIIKIMSNRKSNAAIFILLFVDLILTGIIFLFLMFIGGVLSSILIFVGYYGHRGYNDFFNFSLYYLNYLISNWSSVLKSLTMFDVINVGGIPDSIWFYSTYFTSVWVWLYILTGFMMRTGRAFDIAMNVVKEYLNFEPCLSG